MSILFVLDMIGTVAFAASGAWVAIRKNMDLFGVVALGMVTAIGGGTLRDLMLGDLPPSACGTKSISGCRRRQRCWFLSCIAICRT